jgi:hypothetical protein
MKNARDVKEEKDAVLGEKLSGRKLSKLERMGVFLALLFVAFMLGFIPMWLVKRTVAIERDTVVRELRASQLQNHLGSAMVNARMGEYEAARVSASSFFTELRAELDREENAAFNTGQNEALQPLLVERDDIITLLARSDPAAVERLTNLYLAYMRTVNLVPSQ